MDKEQQRNEDLERIKKLRLFADEFMNACFDKNIECTELVLRIILDEPDLKVQSVDTQKLMKNLHGRDTWLDIHTILSENREADVELQRASSGAKPKRARYHSSILDAHALEPGDDFEKLPETYVIFVTEQDVLGDNQPIYWIERRIGNTGKLFGDEEHILYVNGSDQNGETELGKLMHDFSCTNPDEMYYKQLADRTRYFKETESGVKQMSNILDEMRNEARDEGRIEGRIEGKNEGKWEQTIESVRRWLDMGLSHEQIAKGEGLTVEQVKEIAGEKSA